MQIPFYFDYACPFAYLGSCRVESYFGDLGVEIDFRPVRLETGDYLLFLLVRQAFRAKDPESKVF